MECQYNLMTFGIPCRLLPVSPDGTISIDVHREWLQRRRQYEGEGTEFHPVAAQQLLVTLDESSGAMNTAKAPEQNKQRILEPTSTVPSANPTSRGGQRVVVPGPFDVLLGRGRLIQEHLGNLRYRQMIDDLRETYDSVSKLEKTNIAKKIVQVVHASHGRFLQKDEGVGFGGFFWIEVDDDTAREKVSHSFRNRRQAEATLRRKGNATAATCWSISSNFGSSDNKILSADNNSCSGNSNDSGSYQNNNGIRPKCEKRESDEFSSDSKRARLQGKDSS